MTDPTAAEAVARRLAAIHPDPWHLEPDDDFDAADEVCDALGIDPDSPLSLLHWHATQTERERAARIAEREAAVDPDPAGIDAAERIARAIREGDQ